MSSRQCSISYQQYPIVLRQNAIAYQQYPIELRQNAMSSKLCPITYRQNARSSKFCPTDVRLFNPEVQFPKASGQQIDADYHLTGSGNYEMYYQRRLKTIEEAEVTSLRGPVHTINLIFNYKTQ